MDIVTNKLSTELLKANTVTVNNTNISSYLKTEIEKVSSRIFKFKGVVSNDIELHKKDATAVVGDVWVVTSLSGNYVWADDIEHQPQKHWDRIGSSFDTTYLDGKYQEKGDYLSSKSSTAQTLSGSLLINKDLQVNQNIYALQDYVVQFRSLNNVKFGTTLDNATTLSTLINNALPTTSSLSSDMKSALSSSFQAKGSYVPTSRKINNIPLTSDITIPVPDPKPLSGYSYNLSDTGAFTKLVVDIGRALGATVLNSPVDGYIASTIEDSSNIEFGS